MDDYHGLIIAPPTRDMASSYRGAFLYAAVRAACHGIKVPSVSLADVVFMPTWIYT